MKSTEILFLLAGGPHPHIPLQLYRQIREQR